MWNSLIFACHGWALYGLFEEALPDVTAAYLQSLERARSGEDVRGRAIAWTPAHDFGRDVLQRSTEHLRLVGVPPCGWTELGTPARLASWLDRHREAFFWREHRLPRLGDVSGPGDGGGLLPA